MKAIIIAAGMGVRMGPRGEVIPKGLMRLGSKSIIEESIQSLHDVGITDICLVTGHLADQYHDVLREISPTIEIRHSPAYATTNSLTSLLIGLKGYQGPCVVLESDLTYEPRALSPVTPNVSRVLVSGPMGAGDEVFVWADQKDDKNQLVEMSKNASVIGTPHFGELIGITCLTAVAQSKLQSIGHDLCTADPKTDYETGLVQLAKTVDVACYKMDELLWAEIDDEEMFARALTEVFPEIERARGNAELN